MRDSSPGESDVHRQTTDFEPDFKVLVLKRLMTGRKRAVS
jgi:hypothetical protein